MKRFLIAAVALFPVVLFGAGLLFLLYHDIGHARHRAVEGAFGGALGRMTYLLWMNSSKVWESAGRITRWMVSELTFMCQSLVQSGRKLASSLHDVLIDLILGAFGGILIALLIS